MCVIVDFKSINVDFYQTLVHVRVIFRNLIFVCITIKDKLIKHLYNSHLRKLPIAHGEVSAMKLSAVSLRFVLHVNYVYYITINKAEGRI